MTNKCEPIHHQIIVLRNEIQQIQDEPGYIQGPHDPHPGKPDPEMLVEVKALWKEVAIKSAQYNTCMLSLPDSKPDKVVVFNGQAVLTTSDSHANGPFTENISIELLFHKYDHRSFDVIGFPPIIVGPFSTPAGSNTTTITLKGAAHGSFEPASGTVKLTLPLHFHESHIFAADSDITFLLSTETQHPKASRMDNAGHVTISGTATFQSGFLGGDTGTLTVKGTLSPHP